MTISCIQRSVGNTYTHAHTHTRTCTRTHNENTKVQQGCMIQEQKQKKKKKLYFFGTSSEQLENEIKKTSITIASKIIKYLAINLSEKCLH